MPNQAESSAILDKITSEAADWCMPRLRIEDLKQCWRSEELRPKHLEPNRASTVGNLVRQRRLNLRGNPSSPPVPGRLLAYFPDAELSDGAAEVETAGFFDVYNEPPWGCWIGWVEANDIQDASYRMFLLAWVPNQLRSEVSRGVDVNPEQCIQWMDALPAVYHEALRRSSLAEG